MKSQVWSLAPQTKQTTNWSCSQRPKVLWVERWGELSWDQSHLDPQLCPLFVFLDKWHFSASWKCCLLGFGPHSWFWSGYPWHCAFGILWESLELEYGMLRIQPRLATCKTIALPTVLPFWSFFGKLLTTFVWDEPWPIRPSTWSGWETHYRKRVTQGDLGWGSVKGGMVSSPMNMHTC